MPTGSGAGSAAGRSSSSTGGNSTRGLSHVTTPAGPHYVGQTARQPSIFAPLRGSQERKRSGTVDFTSIRAGAPTVSSVTTAQVRQRAPFPARTFGMAPVVRTRRIAPVR